MFCKISVRKDNESRYEAYNKHSRRNRMYTELIFLFFGLITAQGVLQKPYSAASILFMACKEVTLQASAKEMPHFLSIVFASYPFLVDR
jgi:hypothetical protein